MNKLGFAIKVASDGAANAIECNKGPWTNKVVDIREYLKLFKGLQDTDNIITFMSFDEEGCFLTQLRSISGRILDFLSGWIYIPNTIDITDEEIMSTYNYVRNILSESNLNEVRESINGFFSKEYPNKDITTKYSPSKGDLFGIRVLGHYNLKEIIGTNRYQPYYSKYKAIFIMDNNSEVKLASEHASRFENLTNLEINTLCYVLPPSRSEIQRLGIGTRIMCLDGKEFMSPITAVLGETKTFFALRDGFERILIKLVVESDYQQFSLQKTFEWTKIISYSSFNIHTRDNKKVEDILIFVNGKELIQGMSLTEEECKHARVSIKSDSYMQYDRNNNLLNEPCDIMLEEKTLLYNYDIELANGHTAKMTLESKYLSNSKGVSPLKGYTFSSNEYGSGRVLRLSSRNVWKQRFIGFAAAFAIFMFIGICSAISSWFNTHELVFGIPPYKEIQTTDNQETSEDSTTVDQSLGLAISYMEKNDKWTKDSLESFNATMGLYDLINGFKFNELADYPISESSKLTEIIKLSSKMRDIDFHMDGTYSNDNTITIQKWIDKVKSKSNDVSADPFEDDLDMGDISNEPKSNDLSKQVEKKEQKKVLDESRKKQTETTSQKKSVTSDGKKTTNNKQETGNKDW